MPPHEFLNSTHDYKWFRFVIFKGYKPRPFWYCDDALDFCIQPMIPNLKWISLFKMPTKVSLGLLNAYFGAKIQTIFGQEFRKKLKVEAKQSKADLASI